MIDVGITWVFSTPPLPHRITYCCLCTVAFHNRCVTRFEKLVVLLRNELPYLISTKNFTHVWSNRFESIIKINKWKKWNRRRWKKNRINYVDDERARQFTCASEIKVTKKLMRKYRLGITDRGKNIKLKISEQEKGVSFFFFLLRWCVERAWKIIITYLPSDKLTKAIFCVRRGRLPFTEIKILKYKISLKYRYSLIK